MDADKFAISHEWEDPEGLHQLLQAVRELRPDANVRAIRYAYFLAEDAHKGQLRSSGEPYIQHPLEVARILVELKLDDESIIAGLLHDVLEDTDIPAEKIESIFGEDVKNLVEGVTKLAFSAQEELTARQRAAAESNRAAESLRKMLLAMARDFRVMVIKLADRLHNMRTLGALPAHKRLRIANETLDVFAPLAARLGIWQIKWQLEDLAFFHLHPNEYEEVSQLVAESREEREANLQTAIVAIKEGLETYGIRGAEIQGRPKHLYSIFNKMVKQGVEFEEIYDLLALRVILPGSDKIVCYTVQGIILSIWPSLPELSFDYIAKPKANGYRSLHLKVLGPGAKALEIQVRTMEMHQVAEFGVAAHWSYKEGKEKGAGDEATRLSKLREQLFDFSGDARLSSDFLRSVSTDLFSEQVFVFTPQGDVVDLPVDSTAVDFAFRVHTQVGLTLTGVKINGQIQQLETKLKNGDVVEIVRRKDATPSMDWLKFVVSAHAKSKIKAYFRRVNKDDDAARGKEMIEREFRKLKLDSKEYLTEDKLKGVLPEIEGADEINDIYSRIGSGMFSLTTLVNKLRGISNETPSEDQIQISRTREGKLILSGDLGNVMVHRSRCCLPIPGDEIVGYVTRGRGIYLHRKACPNALHYAQKEPERLLEYDWIKDVHAYGVPIKIISLNRQGLLADISNIFGEAKANVSGANIKTLANSTAEIFVTIDVTDTVHVQQIFDKISNLSDIISIVRMYGRTAK